ncbi:FecCD family ABC transporter permease [Polycladidibacter hongkongensis]|uniref:FecCD family ABC transporter permease n=1 Tax=Polycladidibacter hongkongensis TaxID=1647556 RepID=UPI00082BBA8C|nr:iron ABC transporter permease [Pseudovibrio hongkongensis]
MTLSQTSAIPLKVKRTFRQQAQALTLPLGLVSLFVATCYSLTIGASDLDAPKVLAWGLEQIGGPDAHLTSLQELVLVKIRLPRVLLAILVGSTLAVAGVMMQGLFRNPLADPGIIGVANGAALAAVTAITLSSFLPIWLMDTAGAALLPLAAFLGAASATLLLYRAATQGGQTNVATMLLAGIAFSAIAGAFTGVVVFNSNDDQLRDFTFWTMGSLGGATWERIVILAPLCLLMLLAMPLLSRGLNALLLGEAEAYHMGIDTQKTKRAIILLTAAGVGGAVATAGIIGFASIIVPHVLRQIIGPDHRVLLPASAIGGAFLLVLSDMIARTIVAPAELPIGIITAIIGAPVFLSILLSRRRQMQF